MASNERFLNDFCIYYKRIMRVERYLKDLIVDKYYSEYGDNAYKLLYKRYFKDLRKSNHVNFTPFESVHLSEGKTDKEKLVLSVDKMFISEVLSMFSHKVYLKNSVRNVFFTHNIKTGKNDFRRTAKALKEFRNAICHFDIKEYVNDKGRFVNALLFFEKLLDCRYKFTSGAIQSISHKLSIKSILELIYNQHPEYFNDDRVLVNVFDDLALLAGFRVDNLPQYKTIIRSKFQIQADNRHHH